MRRSTEASLRGKGGGGTQGDCETTSERRDRSSPALLVDVQTAPSRLYPPLDSLGLSMAARDGEHGRHSPSESQTSSALAEEQALLDDGDDGGAPDGPGRR